MDINEQIALIPGPVEIHTASICPRGGIDLTITVPEEIGRKTLGELQSQEGMQALARAIVATVAARAGVHFDMEAAPAGISQEQRDQWRAMREGASAGEWVAFEHLHAENAVGVKGFERTRRIADIRTDPADYGRGNARYIAAAVNALPRVLDVLDVVQAQRDELLRLLGLQVPSPGPHSSGGAVSDAGVGGA